MSQPAIFISYRRKDTAPYARSIHERLEQEFGEGRVFMDLTIPAGMDFLEAIRSSIKSSGAILVVIGPHWLVDQTTGRKRLEDPEDYVRLEVATAIQEQDLVIPVLVGGARMPHREDLPEAIRPLARREAIEITDQRWAYDMGRLTERLREILPPAVETTQTKEGPAEVKPKADRGTASARPGFRLAGRPKLVWGALALALLVAGVVTVAVVTGGGSGDDAGFTELAQGDTGPAVTRLEDRLDGLGFNANPLDGRFDTQTGNAVFAFELCWGLPDPDRVADPEMQSELFSGGKDVGTPNGETLPGTESDDVIFLREGDDTSDASGGNDTVCGGEGDDTIDGGPGDDHLHGGAGDDTLLGGEADDTLIGFKGADTVDGGEGEDTCLVDSEDTGVTSCETMEPEPVA
jgi:TIR domain/RTX calcium-binding nonapeptide repeat (4 copies)/Putative peptidoglycan binding domain